MERVLILMSTYNGEKYLADQIESILKLKGISWDLLIRDDGSKDNTISILDKYSKSDDRITYISGDNIGVKFSFLTMIQKASTNYDYYALADQDDLWHEDKLKRAIELLKTENNKIPLVYGSAVNLLYSKGVRGTQFSYNNIDRFSLGNYLIKNYFPGCTMVFNRELKKLVEINRVDELNKFPLHDHWLCLICTACGGKVIYDADPKIDYRQHSSNAVGDRSLIQKVKGNGLIGKSNNTRYKIAQELSDKYYDHFSENGKMLINTIINYQKSFSKRFGLAASTEIRTTTIIENFSKFFMVLLGKF